MSVMSSGFLSLEVGQKDVGGGAQQLPDRQEELEVLLKVVDTDRGGDV